MNRYWGNHHRANGTPAKRPRDCGTALRKYIDWNLHGDGREQTSSRGSVYWHRNEVFYRNWKPVARCLFGDGRMALVKLYDEGLGLWRNDDMRFIDEASIFNVQDICIWGPAKGMMMPDEDFIEVMRLQWLSLASYMVEAASGLSYDRCAEWVSSEQTINMATGRKAHHDYQIDTRIDMITNMANDHQRFSEMFNLAWDDFPKFALINLYLKIVRDKAKVYEANAPRRERTQARKDGVKALTEAAE